MIVQCASCQAKFKIADDRVTERGVRVRCTRCSAIFVARKQNESASELDARWQPAVDAPKVVAAPHVPTPTNLRRRAAKRDPFGFDALLEDIAADADTSHPASQTGAASTTFSKLAPLPPPPIFNTSTIALPPELDLDFGSSAPEPPAATPTRIAQEMAAPLPEQVAEPEAQEPPPPSVPAETAQESPPETHATAAEAPPSQEPEIESFDVEVENAADDVAEAKAETAVPQPAPTQAPMQTMSQAPSATPRTTTSKTAEAAMLHSRRQQIGAALSAVTSLFVMVGTFVALSMQQGTFNPLGALGFSDSGLVAHQVVSGTYTTVSGRNVFYVRGNIVNEQGHATRDPVHVHVELTNSDGVIGHAETIAGADATPEQVHALADATADDAFAKQLVARAQTTHIADRANAPFFALFFDYPGDLSGQRLRITAAEEPAIP